MQNVQSIFHKLQKEGVKTLEVSRVKEGFTLDFEPFIAKVSNRFNDQFPVSVIDSSVAGIITEKYFQIQAANGLELKKEKAQSDYVAALSLLTEELFSVRLPARRFGIEVWTDTSAAALVFEAVKVKQTVGTGAVYYTASECTDFKISDCNFFNIYSLEYDLSKPWKTIVDTGG